MDSVVLIILLVVVVLALVAAGAWFVLRNRRSRGLRDRFGPEYERSIALTDDRRAVESELRQREKRYRDLDIRPLGDEERARFTQRWDSVQQGFVDDPGQAVRDADALVDDVMRARGYPLDDFEQRAADISVEYPIVVQRYREARDIAEAHDAGQAGTEDLRQAVTSYRALINTLLDPGEAGAERAPRVREDPTDGQATTEPATAVPATAPVPRQDSDRRVADDGSHRTDPSVDRADPDLDHTQRQTQRTRETPA